jgi:uncharacterized protein
MNEQQNIEAVKNAYAAFQSGDTQAVLDALTDDVVWELLGPSQIPYAGTYNGKAATAEFFSTLAQSDEVEAFEPRRFFADGDTVVVLGHYAARVKANGAHAETDWVHVFTFRGDKVASWREYFDSARYALAYTATPA